MADVVICVVDSEPAVAEGVDAVAAIGVELANVVDVTVVVLKTMTLEPAG